MAEAVWLGEGVYWVGATLADDSFQCHAYLVVAGESSVLIDPGSPLTIEQTLEKVASVVPLTSLRYLVCHHSDPDIAAALPILSERLERPDVLVVTEWRAEALLKHYGHRFGYYLVEDHDWQLRLSPDRVLEFQLTPYLHFPGALVSRDSTTGILFSADLFGGFVPDASVLESHDLTYIIDSARPFHQHYMPGHALLESGLRRVQQRWPEISMIAPQHGHVIPSELVTPAFEALEQLDCGVFSLADADFELTRLLRLSEAKERLAADLLTVSDLPAVAAAIDAAILSVTGAGSCALLVDVPGDGWQRCDRKGVNTADPAPRASTTTIPLPGPTGAWIEVPDPDPDASADVHRLLTDLAVPIRAAVDQHLQHEAEEHAANAWRTASYTDPLTGLANRRALAAEPPSDRYALLSLDLDHFKSVNDTFGHAAGDHVLQSVANAITSTIRAQDRAYRVGGEELLVVLPDTDAATASRVAERVRTAVAALPLSGYCPNGTITVSIGIAAHARSSNEVLDLALARADDALYQAKESGRNQVVVAPTDAPLDRVKVEE